MPDRAPVGHRQGGDGPGEALVTGHASTDMVARYERRRDAMVNSAVDRLDLPSLNGL